MLKNRGNYKFPSREEVYITYKKIRKTDRQTIETCYARRTDLIRLGIDRYNIRKEEEDRKQREVERYINMYARYGYCYSDMSDSDENHDCERLHCHEYADESSDSSSTFYSDDYYYTLSDFDDLEDHQPNPFNNVDVEIIDIDERADAG